jgi:RyR domain-containing protein/TrkA family protein
MNGPPSDPGDIYAVLSARQRARRRTQRALETLVNDSGQGARPRVRGPKSRVGRVEWILLPVFALAAFFLVLFGDDGFQWDDDPFRAIEAFTAGFPERNEVDGFALTLGRTLAPVVALYATIRLVMVLYAQRIREWYVRNFRDHTIVVGLGETGLRAVQQYRRDGTRVTAVTHEPFGTAAEDALRSRAYVVSGSGTDPAALHAAGIARAARVLCAEADDVVNVQVALGAVDAHSKGSGRPLEILAEASEGSPATALLEAAPITGEVSLFSLREVWAWRLLGAGPLWRYRSEDEKPPDIVLIGGSELASALLMCACRWWHFDAYEQRSRERLRIVVIDSDAEAICAEALSRHTELGETIDLQPLALDLAAGFDGIGDIVRTDGRQWVVYICLDASDAIRQASARVVQRRLTGSTEGAVVVAVSEQSDTIQDASPLIREVEADDPERGFDPDRFDRVEALARAIHGVYERHMRASGEITAPALQPFDELPPHLQESNRGQARNVRGQLVSVLATTVPLRDWARVREFVATEIEVLSELEHIRWCSERVASGWTYGPKRSDEQRRHPDLVPWSELPENRREINRAFMDERPWTLARVGEGLARHPAREHLARRTHELYRREVSPSAPRWVDLPDAERAASRAFVDDVPAKLLLLGRRITSKPETGSADELTDDEVELLARRDHERWAEFRGGKSWTDAGGSPTSHPDFVPWEELAEDRREIDRMLVRAIPAMLAEAGLAVEHVSYPFPVAPARSTGELDVLEAQRLGESPR